MKLKIHRGTHEIGGSCVELGTDSGKTRIVIDIGMPLVTPEGSTFEWREYKGQSTKQLLEQKVLPQVDGLYPCQSASVSALLVSHAHQDHYGFLRFLHPDIPVYMSGGTRGIVEVSNLFLDTRVNLGQVQSFTMWQQFQIGEFTITPYLMDHSAPDAAAFLIEADGKRVFYTGDFRGHGRKGILLKRLLADPIPNVDCLIMEGSMIGREEGIYSDEGAVERAIAKILANQCSYTFVFCSSQNLDRLVSIYRAVKRHRKILVVDLYTALVLDKLHSLSDNIPQFDWRGIRVLYGYAHARKIAEYDKGLLYRYRGSKINWDDIKSQPQDMVILARDNRYLRNPMLRKLQPSTGAKAIYSMWHGYLERTDLQKVLEVHHVEFVEIHTSGHAYVSSLKELALALRPRVMYPIHTFQPEEFGRLFANVVQIQDGEEREV
ncbi:MAG: MBL fold metallo-hydrolase [Dehalococcoidia bacterium]|nr:MBL fold metallo-hydrolase [Dehalococcoidia bacterium]